jgi:c-di-GMP-binding flagellar brake protein YcgR
MDASQVLHKGQPVHITADDESIDYQGTILELSARFLAIRLDVDAKTFLDAPAAGQLIHCAVTGNGCVFRFQAGFRSSSALPATIWYLEKPETVSRVQLRRFVRVPMALPLSVKLPGEHGSLHNAAEATLVDISGGGICFANTDEVPLKVRIAIDIPNLPLFGTLRTFAQVERCTAIEVFNGKIYHIGASLENDLSKKEQEKLIQCIFELQRKYLRKGLRMPNIDHTKKP